MLKVSIVISSYNYEKYVAQAIESALSQTYRNIEIIVVDDGSSDGSPDIINGFSAQAKIVLKKNGGEASTFNAGYAHTTGDLVIFLDCDDVLEPDAVAKCVAAWKPEYSKIHFPMEITLGDNKRTGTYIPRAKLPAGDILDTVLQDGAYVSPPNSGNIFGRRYLEKIMPIPEREWSYGPDTYLVFLAPFYGSVGALDEPLVLYRRHVHSVTNITRANQGEVGLKLKPMMQAFLHLRELLERTAAEHGKHVGQDAVVAHWLCLKVRLAMARVAPTMDPLGAESSWRAARKLVRSVWRTTELTMIERLEYTLWSILVAISPLRAAIFLVKLAFAPGERKHLMRSVLGLAAAT